MKRIILSLVLIAVAGTGVIGATRAYFSDTVTSNGNTFSTGTLNLTVDNKEDPLVLHLARTNLKPNAPWTTQYGGQWVIKNTGSISGTVTVTIKNLKDYENGCLDPETETGDITCGSGVDQGELGKGLLKNIVWQLNQAPWGSLTPSFSSLTSAIDVPVTGVKYHLDPGESKNAYLNINWDNSSGDNQGQSDGVEFDVEFVLNQDP
ncbi:MAG: hypothetical protein UU09_C0006G0012 [Microgenomates group bacterium GW2011_GWA2_40_6]|nr:MAG: hypothetical protein UU09_C0006G0012 [Microgenomates group bacterium GW2011_GWA2_40_6]